MSGTAFPEREYPRRCAMCGFIADPGYPWDERLVLLGYCPRCALPLERVACQACGAPPVTEVVYTMLGGQAQQISDMCGYCGERITRVEPQLRQKPTTPTNVDSRRVVTRSINPQEFDEMILSPFARVESTFGTDPAPPPPAADPRPACVHGKPHPLRRLLRWVVARLLQ